MITLVYFFSQIVGLTYSIEIVFTTEDAEQRTSLKIIEILESLPEFSFKILTPDALINHLDPLPELIIYFPQSTLFTPTLTNFANSYHIPTILFGKGVNLGWIFYTMPSIECLINSTKIFIKNFKMTQFGIIWQWGEENSNFIQKLKENNPKSKNFCLNKSVSKKKISGVLANLFKANAITNILAISNEKTICKNIEEGILKNKMEKSWNLVLYFEECTYTLSRTGNFGIIYTPLNSAKNEDEYIKLALLQYFELISSVSLNRYQIKYLFDTIFIHCKYSIINIKSEKKVIIGEIYDGNIEIYSESMFFTGINKRVITNTPPIEFSSNTGTKNPPGFPDIIQNSRYQEGTYFAVDFINSQHNILPKFELQLFDKVSCGVNVFIYNYSQECFLNVSDHLGVAYIPPLYGTTLIPVINQLKDLGIAVPAIAGMGSSSILSNSTLYPYFKRMVTPLNFNLQIFANYLSIMNWENVVIFYTDESFGQTIYNLLNSYSNSYRYRFANDEKYRKVPYISAHTDKKEYINHLNNALSTNCNIYLLAMSDPAPYFWLEILYDFGFRRGDITIFFFTVTGTDALNSKGGDLAKRSELMHGSFVMYNAAWVGQYGNTMKALYLEQNQNSWMPSFYIDTVYTIAYTVEFIIDQGKDYEDPKVFIDSIQNTKFLGVTGTVSFDSSTNDRNLFYFNIYNFYESDGQWYSKEVGLITPLSSVYYQVLNDYVWSSGSKPRDIKLKYLNCDFNEDLVQESIKSNNLQLGLILFLLVYSIILAIYIQVKLKIERPEKISFKTKALFMDYVVLFFIFFECLQLISIGPSVGKFNSFISNLSKIFSFEFSDFFNFRNDEYWIIYFTLLVSGYAWILLCIFDSRTIRAFINRPMRNLTEIKQFLVPIISNFVFIPLSNQMLEILLCRYSVGNKLTESFYDFDCNVWCWKGKHLYILIFSILLFCLFVPVSLYYRIIWSRGNYKVQIKESDFYITVKSIILLLLIGIDQAVVIRDKLIHAVLYLCVLFMLTLFLMLFQPFNFDRANLWSRIMNLCVLWNSIVCLIEITSKLDAYVLLILQIGGWILILCIGIFMNFKLPPSLLVTNKGRTVVELFKFVFGYGDFVATRYLKNTTTLNIGEREESDNYSEKE